MSNTQKIEITLTINGEKKVYNTFSMEKLINVIREEAFCTGTKEGCGEGECGACSIILNGQLVNSCIIPAIQADNSEILTIEGIGQNNALSKIQQAFLKYGGAQCGFCTPGMIIAANSLLQNNSTPKIKEIKEGLSGNLCRCTGYIKIFESVVNAISEGRNR